MTEQAEEKHLPSFVSILSPRSTRFVSYVFSGTPSPVGEKRSLVGKLSVPHRALILFCVEHKIPTLLEYLVWIQTHPQKNAHCIILNSVKVSIYHVFVALASTKDFLKRDLSEI